MSNDGNAGGDDNDDNKCKDGDTVQLLLLGPVLTVQLNRCDFYQLCFKCMCKIQLLPIFTVIFYGLILSCFAYEIGCTEKWMQIEVLESDLQVKGTERVSIYLGNMSCKDGHNKGQKWYAPNRSRRY